MNAVETMDERLARERSEWRAEVERIGAALGGDWGNPEDEEHLSNSGYWTFTSARMRARLFLRAKGDRLEFSVGIHPPIAGGKLWTPGGPASITLARSKAPERIAADVRRRILEHVPDWVRCAEQRALERDAEEQSVADAAQRCAEACGGDANVETRDGKLRALHSTYRPGDVIAFRGWKDARRSCVTGSTYQGDGLTVSLDLRNLSLVEALAILKLWRSMEVKP